MVTEAASQQRCHASPARPNRFDRRPDGAGYRPGPPRPRAVHALWLHRLLDDRAAIPTGKRAVVIGRSDLVGKPIAELLLHATATVTIPHSRTRSCRRSAAGPTSCRAVGKTRWSRSDWVKPGAVVIDVGSTAAPREARGCTSTLRRRASTDEVTRAGRRRP